MEKNFEEKCYRERSSIKVRVSKAIWNYVLNTYSETTIKKIKKDFPAFVNWTKG